MDGNQTSLTNIKKVETSNTQVDEQGQGKIEAQRSVLVANETQNLGSAISNNFDLFRSFSAGRSNHYTYDEVSRRRTSNIIGILEALTDCNVNIIGAHGQDNVATAVLMEKVSRRAKRDELFDKVVMARVKRKPITRKPDVKRIQAELADALGLKLEEKAASKRAGRLHDRIKMEQKILIILQDLCKKLDLNKVGIPSGDHTGCKILLTSTKEKVLTNKMHAQKVFVI